MIGADAGSIAGIARVTELKMRTSGMATKRLMLVECWGLLLVVEVVEGGWVHEELRVSVEVGGQLRGYVGSACGGFTSIVFEGSVGK